MIKTESVDTAVQKVTNVLIAAADLSIPKSSSHSFQRYKPWWSTDCQTAYKNQRKLWGIFHRYPTTENLLAFKKAKANARRVRHQSQSSTEFGRSIVFPPTGEKPLLFQSLSRQGGNRSSDLPSHCSDELLL
ncbi:RNase H domain-containing protein [Trichonephila clavipes]|nr:RNase H domain-containing protein [Trichonephila clavipes]